MPLASAYFDRTLGGGPCPLGLPGCPSPSNRMSFQQRFLSNVRGDLFGGITAGIVALPLALAFGVSSGLENGAAAGLYGAIAIGILSSIFGGTPSQVSGPTGPMTIVVAGLVTTMTGDPAWVFAAVMLAGAFQMILGLLRVGHYINFIPYPVISGFMSGIGLIIILLQLAQLVGQPAASGTVQAIGKIPGDLANMNVWALGLGLATIAIIYLTPRVTKVVPGTLIGLVAMTIVAAFLPGETPLIGTIPQGLPELHLPAWDFDKFKLILLPALALAAVGSIDSLLTSLVADAVTKTRHDSERELFGQGLGNVASGLIGGLPGAGATMRTVVNVQAGGRTHLSGVVHGLLLVSVLLVLAPLAEQIPKSVLAGILITVGIGIVDVKGLRHLLRVPRGDAAVMLTVLGLTVFANLMLAVAIGMVMAAMILLKRLSDIDPATHSPLLDIAAHRPWIPPLEQPKELLDGLYLVELHGSLFFGNSGPLQRTLEGIPKQVRSVVLHMGDVRFIDQSGAYALSTLIEDLTAEGISVYFAELRQEPAEMLSKLEILPGELPAERSFGQVGEAIQAAATQLESRG